VTATRDINAGEELIIDRGVEFWQGQRAALERYTQLLAVAEELQMGVQKPEQIEEKPAVSFGKRKPRPRISSKQKRR